MKIELNLSDDDLQKISFCVRYGGISASSLPEAFSRIVDAYMAKLFDESVERSLSGLGG